MSPSSAASTTRSRLAAARRPAARGAAGSSLQISAAKMGEPRASASRVGSQDPPPPSPHGLWPAANAGGGGGRGRGEEFLG